ncbi:thioredoxin [uncultured Selenomonas sp.]|uniref:thioredoxin n=1 Tax=uncultured Selenomonas sp. TaxID=159275 RepID=UPI0028EE1D79|nr:thioredoxin [uncultured Selenomonas sp.]
MAVIELTRETFASEVLAETRMVVVDFWASYCMPCRMLIPVLEEASAARSDVKFYKINVDDAQDIAERYGVMSMPILIFFKNGEPVDESIGLITKDELLAILEKNK